ncbi:MAG TPA: 16S rRNA (cytidine(1402)-2'-O)-methyltransferase [Candidatus Sulfobium mesophilum]|jgi:16S rRNA (cytidine1402-2'-O)-methyltransferase|nr:16S rRNA (cytidine(1402)-2'-O)-methyltransferase [Candidatus Sulfobium mesophilum]
MPKGTLYIVSTPIGNLEDITFRAIRILKEADVIAAEDTRHTLKLLNYYGIAKPMISYWGERERARAEEVIERLSTGHSVALVSDAGTPGISDPGGVLIKRALEEGFDVVPVPGPVALIAALTISGFPTEEFVFCGFLPAKQSQRRKFLDELSLEKRTVVVYESPHRIVESMAEMSEIFGQRRMVLAREITKLHEEVMRGTVSEVFEVLIDSKIAGEYVLVVEGRPEAEDVHREEDAVREIRSLMRKGMGRKEAVKRVAEQYGLSRKELYDRSLEGE